MRIILIYIYSGEFIETEFVLPAYKGDCTGNDTIHRHQQYQNQATIIDWFRDLWHLKAAFTIQIIPRNIHETMVMVLQCCGLILYHHLGCNKFAGRFIQIST